MISSREERTRVRTRVRAADDLSVYLPRLGSLGLWFFMIYDENVERRHEDY
jgi:hypothetical protein